MEIVIENPRPSDPNDPLLSPEELTALRQYAEHLARTSEPWSVADFKREEQGRALLTRVGLKLYRMAAVCEARRADGGLPDAELKLAEMRERVKAMRDASVAVAGGFSVETAASCGYDHILRVTE